MINLILSGGSGTRLWPLSRTKLPKQFVRLFNNQSLFQLTVNRNATVCNQTLVVSNKDQYFLALDQLNELNFTQAKFLLEPVGRNTAPAIALGCMLLQPEQLVLVTTSDHLIQNQTAYEQAVLKAKQLAEADNLVTFGIKPTYAETGFGYIQAQGEKVLSFTEKPNAELAASYLAAGNYYWNSGMFCFKAGVFLQELQQHSPEIYQACQAALAGIKATEEVHLDTLKMQAIPADSIDYAVMEKSNKVKVVACDLGWSDLGSFDSLYDELNQEQQADNAILLRGTNPSQPLTINSNNNLVVAREKQIALVDVDDLLIVDTADALLISKKGSSQKVKQLVEQIKQTKPALTEIHNLAYRPWGSYEVLIDTLGYKVKRLVVKPQGVLSLQKHYHRNEHWIVVSGTASVTVDSKKFLLRPNESTYIKMGEIHRLENHGKIDLVMIEVQVGEYTGEDDIERLEDNYGRQ